MITAEVLGNVSGVRHAFFTRRGGVSEGAYASLNCGYGSGDDPERVRANRARAAQKLGLDGSALATAYQTHSAAVAVVDGAWAPEDAPRADGLVTATPGIAIGVLTADCVPVLFADPAAGVVGAAHAGWRGARAGILEATVEAMTELGARTADIVAGIGPCIGQGSYEVGPEFHTEFVTDNPGNEDFFTPDESGARYLFDLSGYVGRRLSALALAAVEAVSVDSCADEERFFSYRRAARRGETAYGRGLSAIVLDAGAGPPPGPGGAGVPPCPT